MLMTVDSMITNNNICCHRGERKMNYQNEKEEIIEFCLKHDLIKRTNYGYVVRRTFYNILDTNEA